MPLSFSSLRQTKFWTIPNVLTLFRIVSAPLVFYFAFCEKYGVAVVLYWFSSMSDGLDGFLARRFHWESLWGRCLDPIADKALAFFSYCALFSEMPELAVLVIMRDVLILLAVFFAKVKAVEIPIQPLRVGKLHTLMTLFLPFLWLLDKTVLIPSFPLILKIFQISVVVTTVVSLAAYAIVFFKGLKKEEGKTKP
ncbi:CDP-alcohol phosphatidyltransferase [Alphaproteobacteria bacterium]|nr:CDP-alcohol phosphatidyltransferase [Alphaproteobacteria bacterium]GHS96083.1 CDP-alcohol phosphatidyltransferase [Alphaproteobacteria bacterium]